MKVFMFLRFLQILVLHDTGESSLTAVFIVILTVTYQGGVPVKISPLDSNSKTEIWLVL